uniref:ArfGAP with dual PH domains 1 n=1 Tax=Scleropages formosus TaxID=113540 RepID=A0A8C9T996_SCLFO
AHADERCVTGTNRCLPHLSSGPQWGSTSLGVLLCQACSIIHKKILPANKVKHLSSWEVPELKTLAENGNAAAKAKYEVVMPIYYYRPRRNDCQVLKEEWVKAKYERQEFVDPMKKQSYQEEVREGWLMKLGRDNGLFLKRKFVLREKDGKLKYYPKEDEKDPKAVINVETMNPTFQPEKIGHRNGLQITYQKEHRTRNLFLYHEDGKEIVDWFNTIRAVQFKWLKLAFPAEGDQELLKRLPRNFLKEGFMEKTGPKKTESFKKRWFTLDKRRLLYFCDPLDAFPKGEVFLGHKDNGYSAGLGLPKGTESNGAWKHGITLDTPKRCYLFTCESEGDQKDWLDHFNAIINTAMSPHDYAQESLLKHK